MPVLVNVEGQLVPPEQATVSVFDRGFLYGDSVYEVARTYGGRPFELGRHLDRMDRSADRIGLTLPPRERIEGEIQRTIDAARNPESYVRIVVTRGEGRFGLSPHLAQGMSRMFVIVREEPFGPEALAAADEVFVTSTIREVMPVTSLVLLGGAAPDVRRIGDRKQGPVTRRLHEAFRKYVARTHGA